MNLGYRIPRDGVAIFIPPEVAQRAHDRFVTDDNGCHITTYSLASSGYGQVGWSLGNGRNQMVTTHRAAWVHVNGQIPLGLTVDHVCHTKPCVNVAHLRLLPNRVNAADNGQVRVNPPAGRMCPQGHEMSISLGDVRRQAYCRECKAAYKRVRRAAGLMK